MNKELLENIQRFLIKNVFRNPDMIFDKTIRGETDDGVDLLSVIASLFNLLYKQITGESYEYFFHWANKVGGWVDDNYFVTANISKREAKVNRKEYND